MSADNILQIKFQSNRNFFRELGKRKHDALIYEGYFQYQTQARTIRNRKFKGSYLFMGIDTKILKKIC